MKCNNQDFVLDSSIFIAYLRGDKRALNLLSQIPRPYISVLTAAELLAGAITRTHLEAVEVLLREVQLVDVNLPISREAAGLIRQHPDFFGKKILHSIIDAFIVASGIYLGKPILTLDIRHFSRFKIDKVKIVSFKRKDKIWKVTQ